METKAKKLSLLATIACVVVASACAFTACGEGKKDEVKDFSGYTIEDYLAEDWDSKTIAYQCFNSAVYEDNETKNMYLINLYDDSSVRITTSVLCTEVWVAARTGGAPEGSTDGEGPTPPADMEGGTGGDTEGGTGGDTEGGTGGPAASEARKMEEDEQNWYDHGKNICAAYFGIWSKNENTGKILVRCISYDIEDLTQTVDMTVSQEWTGTASWNMNGANTDTARKIQLVFNSDNDYKMTPAHPDFVGCEDAMLGYDDYSFLPVVLPCEGIIKAHFYVTKNGFGPTRTFDIAESIPDKLETKITYKTLKDWVDEYSKTKSSWEKIEVL